MILGLLKKEFHNLRFSLILLGIVFFLYLIFIIVMGIVLHFTPEEVVDETESTLYSFATTAIYLTQVFSCSLIMSSYQIDDKSNWNRYVVANGVPRRKLIYSKILLMLIFNGIGSLFSTLCVGILPMATAEQIYGTFLICIAGTMFFALIAQLVSVLLGGIKANVLYGVIMIVAMIILPVVVFFVYTLEDEKSLQIAIIFGVFIGLALLDLMLFLINKLLVSKRDY